MPLYEVIPLEQIIGTCCVMDLNTHCKGRPKGVQEKDVYVCEYRLDKTAHLFYKISRPRYAIVHSRYIGFSCCHPSVLSIDNGFHRDGQLCVLVAFRILQTISNRVRLVDHI